MGEADAHVRLVGVVGIGVLPQELPAALHRLPVLAEVEEQLGQLAQGSLDVELVPAPGDDGLELAARPRRGPGGAQGLVGDGAVELGVEEVGRVGVGAQGVVLGDGEVQPGGRRGTLLRPQVRLRELLVAAADAVAHAPFAEAGAPDDVPVGLEVDPVLLDGPLVAAL